MKQLFRYRYTTETSYVHINLFAVILTVLWLVVMIAQYPYYMERFGFRIWLCERGGMGIFPAIFWLISMVCMALDGDRKYRKEVMQKGICYDGEIVGYITKRHTYIHNGRKSVVQPKTYILKVECRGETMMTPDLWGNPERVLKSRKCHVYDYGGQKYVTDFDERLFRIGKGVSLQNVYAN